MTDQVYANNAKGRLNAILSDVGTTFTLGTGEGAIFPSPTGNEFFLVTLYEVGAGGEANHEIIRVETRTGDTFSDITRGAEGTVARTWPATTPVEVRVTKGTLDEVKVTASTVATAGGVMDTDFGSQGLMRRGATPGTYSIVTDNSANWNTAFGWGDHAGLYANLSHTHAAADITVGTFANARIAQSNVTQHQAALSITESQISDLGPYNNYSHPAHPGDDFSVDSGALTGATVISDIDINVSTDTLGHVTDANGVIATRTLTLANLGYTGSPTANDYSHPNHTGDVTSTGDGATVIANDAVTFAKMQNIPTANIIGRASAGTGNPEDLTAAQVRTILNVADGANNYSHPTFAGDDINIDTGPLSGATVISDLDFNITTNSEGHVTDANATIATRNITLANLGYTGATDANNYVHPTHPGDDFSVDSGALTGATVISDIDINVTTDTLGHVTDANGVIATRTLTAANLGALPTTGGTLTGKLTTAAAGTGSASLRMPHGTAPTTPTNGDLWTTTAGVFARVNGATFNLTDSGGADPAGTETISGTWTFTGPPSIDSDVNLGFGSGLWGYIKHSTSPFEMQLFHTTKIDLFSTAIDIVASSSIMTIETTGSSLIINGASGPFINSTSNDGTGKLTARDGAGVAHDCVTWGNGSGDEPSVILKYDGLDRLTTTNYGLKMSTAQWPGASGYDWQITTSLYSGYGLHINAVGNASTTLNFANDGVTYGSIQFSDAGSSNYTFRVQLQGGASAIALQCARMETNHRVVGMRKYYTANVSQSHTIAPASHNVWYRRHRTGGTGGTTWASLDLVPRGATALILVAYFQGIPGAPGRAAVTLYARHPSDSGVTQTQRWAIAGQAEGSTNVVSYQWAEFIVPYDYTTGFEVMAYGGLGLTSGAITLYYKGYI